MSLSSSKGLPARPTESGERDISDVIDIRESSCAYPQLYFCESLRCGIWMPEK